MANADNRLTDEEFQRLLPGDDQAPAFDFFDPDRQEKEFFKVAAKLPPGVL